MKELKETFCKGQVKIIERQPIVKYKETITGVSDHQVMAKSANRHNRLYFESLALSEEVAKSIETGEITEDQEVNERARILSTKYGWDKDEAKKIWNFGAFGGKMSNMLIEATKGVQYLGDVREHINSGFQEVCLHGVLCGEELTCACFRLMDAKLHEDRVHRGSSQVMPAARSAVYGCCLVSKPMLLEPYYLVEMVAATSVMSGIYQVIAKRRGNVLGEEQREGLPLTDVKAYIPV